MQEFIAEHWSTLLFALAALLVWTVGNYLKKKVLIYIGIGLCILALLTYTNIFDFVYQI